MDGTYSCSSSSDCIFTTKYVACNGSCICASSYTWLDTRQRCIAKNMGKSSCSSVEDCFDNGNFASCTGRCSCKEGYYYDLTKNHCTITSSWTSIEFFFISTVFGTLLIITIWAIRKDSVESSKNQDIDSLVKTEYNIYCETFNLIQEKNTETEPNDPTTNLDLEHIQKNKPVNKVMFRDNIKTSELIVNSYLRSNELVKVFFFSSRIISRTARAIILALQIQAAQSVFILFRCMFKLSPSWLFLLSLYVSLPIKWIFEYLLSYYVDTRITELLNSQNPIEEISKNYTQENFYPNPNEVNWDSSWLWFNFNFQWSYSFPTSLYGFQIFKFYLPLYASADSVLLVNSPRFNRTVSIHSTKTVWIFLYLRRFYESNFYEIIYHEGSN